MWYFSINISGYKVLIIWVQCLLDMLPFPLYPLNLHAIIAILLKTTSNYTCHQSCVNKLANVPWFIRATPICLQSYGMLGYFSKKYWNYYESFHAIYLMCYHIYQPFLILMDLVAVHLCLEKGLKKTRVCKCFLQLTHWGQVTHICIGNLNTIGSDNGLSLGQRQANIWTISGILSIWFVGT